MQAFLVNLVPKELEMPDAIGDIQQWVMVLQLLTVVSGSGQPQMEIEKKCFGVKKGHGTESV